MRLCFGAIALLVMTTSLACAENKPPSQPPAIQGLLGMIHDATQREAAATVEVLNLRQQIDGLKAQLAAVTQERDDLKTLPKVSDAGH